jgi:hypothetical protein
MPLVHDWNRIAIVDAIAVFYVIDAWNHELHRA